MTTTNTKTKKKKFYGEASGIFLTHWLNGPREKPWLSWKTEFRESFGPISGTADSDMEARSRIVHLVRKLKQFVEMSGELYSDQGDPKDARDWHLFIGLRDSINREYAKYPQVSKININPPIKDSHGHFKPFAPDRRAYDWAISPVPGALLQEMMSVKFIQDADRHGWLHQVRECTVCGRWFFARRHGTCHCSNACRKKEYQASERYKQWRHSHYLHEKIQRIKKQTRLDHTRDK